MLKYKEDDILDIQETGTIRFPNIKSIVKTAVEKFPDAVICFSVNGDRKMFAKYIISMYENKNENLKKEAIEIFEILNIK